MITIDQFLLLQEPAGQRLLGVLRELAPTPSTELAVSSALRKSYPPDLVAAALTQHELRQRGAAKFALADQLWFTRAGLEQATSERVAAWTAQRYAKIASIADLCCGIGGDLLALAGLAHVPHVLAVDRDPAHVAIARANARVAGIGDLVEVREMDVRDVSFGDIDAVFIDPARRNDRGRLGTGVGEPPLDWSLGLVDQVTAVGIKTAPGIDHALVPEGWGMEFIALGTDLKEAMLWSPAMTTRRTQATVIREDRTFVLTEHRDADVDVVTPEPGMWLLDPNPAVTRAGLVESLASQVGAAKIDDRIGFLVSPTPVVSPFARAQPIIASLPWHERNLRHTLRELGAGAVDVRRRGLAGDVDAISRRLRGAGDRALTVAMTRAADRPWAIVCEPGPA